MAVTWTATNFTAVNTSGSVSLPSGVTPGSLLLYAASCGDAGTLATPTDTLGNTWTVLYQGATTNSQRHLLAYAIANGAGTLTLTQTGLSSFYGQILRELIPSTGGAQLDAGMVSNIETFLPNGSPGVGLALTPSRGPLLSVALVGTDTGNGFELMSTPNQTNLVETSLGGSPFDTLMLNTGAYDTVAARDVVVFNGASENHGRVVQAVFLANAETAGVRPSITRFPKHSVRR